MVMWWSDESKVVKSHVQCASGYENVSIANSGSRSVSAVWLPIFNSAAEIIERCADSAA